MNGCKEVEKCHNAADIERIAELGQQLAHKQEQCDQLAHQVLELEEAKKRAQIAGEHSDFWKEKAEQAQAQLSRYQGGVEVEGVIVHVTDWISTKSGLYFPLPEKPFAKGQRVRVHVKEVE